MQYLLIKNNFLRKKKEKKINKIAGTIIFFAQSQKKINPLIKKKIESYKFKIETNVYKKIRKIKNSKTIFLISMSKK